MLQLQGLTESDLDKIIKLHFFVIVFSWNSGAAIIKIITTQDKGRVPLFSRIVSIPYKNDVKE